MDFENRILVGLTGSTDEDWKGKLREIQRFGIKRFTLFLEMFKPRQREMIYEALNTLKIKDIPMVHIKDDMVKEELAILKKRFHTKYMTIHEDHFKFIDKWKGFYKHLYLEMNYDNYINKEVDVKRIGGFCVDLAHFKAGEERWTKDFLYVVQERKHHELFRCNHLGGFNYKTEKDNHYPTKNSDFDYLATLPDFIFGDVIGIEIFRSISEQLAYRDYIIDTLKHKF